MNILAIDPGNEYSAWVVYDTSHGGCVGLFGKEPNTTLLAAIQNIAFGVDRVVCEMIACYGMAVGKEVFETCRWIGRFEQAAHGLAPFSILYRQDVKLHLCGQVRAKDPNVRQALIDRFGGKAAIGKKKTPGPLYGVSGDVWAALGVAVTWAETKHGERK